MTIVFLTGATGFIGGFLAEHLTNDGHEVYGLVRWTSEKKHYEHFKPIFGDLRDYHILMKIIRDLKPQYVFHLAAISPVSYSFENPFEYMEINTTGTINLAEINLRHNKRLQKFLFAGTPEEYGIQETYPIKETAPLRPASPYGISKVAADLYLQYMHQAYEFPVTILRHANCYGRRDQTHFVIESIVTQMLTQEEICLGDPEPVRDFLYITDVINAYIQSSLPHAQGVVYNFGWCHGYSIKEVVETAQKITGFDGDIHWNTLPKRALEIPSMVLDSAKAWKELGWTPEIGLAGGLKKVRDYWKEKILREGL